jgi:dTDP-4-dehydrorhamnose 3,5-epimerase
MRVYRLLKKALWDKAPLGPYTKTPLFGKCLRAALAMYEHKLAGVVDPAMPEVKIVKPRRFEDERGFFVETYTKRALAAEGIFEEFVQDNHSRSNPAGTVRGLHFQLPPFAQAKMVRCSAGRIFDAAVDIRRGSPTYGRHVAVELSAANGWQLLVPIGFAHGLVTLEPATEVQYKVSAYYSPEHDAGIFWNDPALAIPWPVDPASAALSDKDRKLPLLSEFTSPFEYHPPA